MSLWHYTVGVRLRSILVDQVIKPATARLYENELPAVWCSLSCHSEPTANKTMMASNGRRTVLGKIQSAAQVKDFIASE